MIPITRRLTTRQRTERAWQRLRTSRLHLGFVAGAAVALVIALLSLPTVTVHVTGADGLLKGNCGIGYYVFGAPNKAVDIACRAAYARHATTFFVFLVIAAAFLSHVVVDLLRRVDAAATAEVAAAPPVIEVEAAMPEKPVAKKPAAVTKKPVTKKPVAKKAPTTTKRVRTNA